MGYKGEKRKRKRRIGLVEEGDNIEEDNTPQVEILKRERFQILDL